MLLVQQHIMFFNDNVELIEGLGCIINNKSVTYS